MPELTAAVPLETNHLKLFASAEPLTRKNTSAAKGPYVNFDESNRFTLYQQLSTCNPYVTTSLNKFGISLSKGMTFDGTSKKAVKELELYSKKNNFINQVQSIGRILGIHGTYIAKPVYKAGGDSFRLYPLLMTYTSILPGGMSPGKSSDDVLQPNSNPEDLTFYMYESNESKRVTYKFNEVVYCTYNEFDGVQKDVLKRDTYGLYGTSLLTPLIPSISNLLDLNEGFVSYVKKYGNGRYVINLRALEEAVKQGIITPTQASTAVTEFSEDHKNLSENEDMIGAGLEVTTPDPKGSLDISSFKDSLETEIMLGLLQSPLTMGKASGTTYASSYMVEEDRMLVLECFQKILESATNQVINFWLKAHGKPEDSVWVTFDELSKPVLEFDTLLEMCNTGKITDEELRQRAGFPPEKPNGTIGD